MIFNIPLLVLQRIRNIMLLVACVAIISPLSLLVIAASPAMAQEAKTDCKFPLVSGRRETAYKITESQVKECIERGYDPPAQLLPTENEGPLPASHTVFAGQFAASEPPGSAAGDAASGAAASGKSTEVVGALIGGLLENVTTDFDGQYDADEDGHASASVCGMMGDTKALTGGHEVNEFQCGGSVTGLGAVNYFMGDNAQLYGVVNPASKQMALYAQQSDQYAFVKQVQLPVDWCEERESCSTDSDGNESCETEIIHHPISYLFQKLTFSTQAYNVPLELGPGNYDHENEVVAFHVNGTNIVIPNSCGSKYQVLSAYPSAYPGIRFSPSGQAACYKQYIYPSGGFCEGHVLHINKDDTTFAYEPGTRMESRPIEGGDELMIMAGFGTKLYTQSLDMKMGFGQTIRFPNGVLIKLPNKQEFFANGPIDLHADASGRIAMPYGGVLYSADGGIAQEYDQAMQITVSPANGPLKLQVNDHFLYTSNIAMPANAASHYLRATYPSAQMVQTAPLETSQ